MDSTNTKILEKLHLIMSELDYIQKDKTVSFGNTRYNYASEKAIKEAVHPLLVNHKVVVIPSVEREEYAETRLNIFDQKNPGTVIGEKFTRISRLLLKVTFFDTESGESVTASMPGYGEDAGDKAPYKAITGALKYILTSTFLIPTGDDPEGGEEREIKQRSTNGKTEKPMDHGAEVPGTDPLPEKIDHSQPSQSQRKAQLQGEIRELLKDDRLTSGQRTMWTQQSSVEGVTVKELEKIKDKINGVLS